MDKRLYVMVGLIGVLAVGAGLVGGSRPSAAQAAKAEPSASTIGAKAAAAGVVVGAGPKGAVSPTGATGPSGAVAPKAPAPSVPAAPALVAAPAMPKSAMQYVVEHELYTAKFVNQGATLTSFELTRFRDLDNVRPMNLVGGPIEDPSARPFAVEIPGVAKGEAVLYGLHDCVLELRPGTKLGKSFTCVWRNERVQLTKRVQFVPNSYLLNVEVELQNLTDVNLTTTVGMQMTAYQGPVKAGGCFEPPPDVATPICAVKQSTERSTAEDLLKKHQGRQRIDGDVEWSGVDLRYFLAAAVVRDGSDVQNDKLLFRANSCEMVVKSAGALGGRVLPRHDFELGKGEGGKPGKPAIARFAAFLGPKLLTDLEKVTVDKGGVSASAALERSVDYGILGVLCKPMLWLLNFFYGFVGNYGLAIMLLTLVVKILTFWPSQGSYRSMEAMKRMKKPLDELKLKYGHDKAKLNQEMMALYKQHKINPLGGCLPMLIQLPIWIALYRTIYSAVEVYHQPFVGWIHDLSAPDPYYVMPLIIGAVMFVQQMMTPSTGDSAQMRMMQYGMPVMFVLMMLFVPAGLTLYIFVNTVLSIVQQWLVKRSTQVA